MAQNDRGKEEGIHFELGLGGILKGLGSLVDAIEKLADEGPSQVQREVDLGAVAGKRARAVYGFSVRVGGEGRPVIESFGNVREEKGRGVVVDEIREPLVDVFDEGEFYRVVAEMPGAEVADIVFEVRGDVLMLSGRTEGRKYEKELLLPGAADPARAEHVYRNGILELKLWKAEGA